MSRSSTRARLAATVTALLLAGCAAGPRAPAPVVDRTVTAPPGKPLPQARTPAPGVTPPGTSQPAPTPPAAARARSHTVRAGDTLIGIALDNGLDYREVASWNNLADPNRIFVGQVLRLEPPGAPPAAATGEPVIGAAKPQAPIGERPIGAESPKVATAPTPAVTPPAPVDPLLRTEPRAQRMPYSDAALAQLQGAGKAPAARPAEPAAPVARPDPGASPAGDEAITWMWPASGKVIAGFNEAGGAKGMQIAGQQGQPVVATAPGRVVYSGSGLRGYGLLVIIKHNDTYLSAYAHNSQVMVKEGQVVTRGQKIAEMGSTDTDRVKLHFEIRRLGRPVDPAKYLPAAS